MAPRPPAPLGTSGRAGAAETGSDLGGEPQRRSARSRLKVRRAPADKASTRRRRVTTLTEGGRVGRVRRRSLLAFVVASVALGATGFAATGGVPGHHSPGRA